MKTIRAISSGIIILLLISMTAVGQEVIDKTFASIDVLEMEIGGIEVLYTGVPGATTIKLNAQFGNNDDVDRTFVMVTVGNTLKVSYKPQNREPMLREKRFIHLEGPENIKISIRNTSGIVGVRRVVSEETKLYVNSGTINVENIVGNLLVKSNSGKIAARDIEGDLSCTITSGMAEIASIVGNAEINANSGSLKVTDVQGVLNAGLSSGNLRMEDIKELGKISISSGNVRASNCGLGPKTDLEGSSGNIDIQTLSPLDQFNYSLKAGSGSLRVGSISTSKQLIIENGSQHTIKGTINSGSLQIKNL
nr:DUF4097 family beta strand repeat protein [Cytophagales bacterium]